jgi:CubicO group peptidase (beta-lactamase class C family)
VIGLDDSVVRWLPECAPHWASVTVHHLLTHTSGLPHWNAGAGSASEPRDDAADRPPANLPGFDPFRVMELSERQALIAQAPLRGRPGDHWLYTSPGYLLVARIVERAADQAYPTFVRERILTPLGLTSTTVGEPVTSSPARGHVDGQELAWEMTSMPGTCDLWSTVGDLITYTNAVHNGALLSSRSRTLMTTPHAPTGQGEDSYGYGLWVGPIAGHTGYYHPGDVPGFTSLIAWLPEPKVSIAILSNDASTDVEKVARRLLAAGVGLSFLGAPATLFS